MDNKDSNYSHGHHHMEFHDQEDVRSNRLAASAILNIASAGLQLWGGYSGVESVLIVEAAEEFTDGMAFAAAAVEVRTEKKQLSQKARNLAIGFAMGAATIATGITATELVAERGSMLQPLEGIDLNNNAYKAAVGALAINSVVFFLNRNGNKSDKTIDRFAFKDSLKDAAIPATVLGLAAVKAPQYIKSIFEIGAVSYGWYNTVQLYKGWRRKAQKHEAK